MLTRQWANIVHLAKNQVYVSHSQDPYLNLSIENYLLNQSPKYSNVLFIYKNAPSVVFGRNQNPWLEVDLAALSSTDTVEKSDSTIVSRPLLVRRKSGGGAVYHDSNNLNYCAICPTADFRRDKHAEMLVRALRPFNDRARVNTRHDVVLDQGMLLPRAVREELAKETQEFHSTFYQTNIPPLKVSGSAFKLVKGRALHHGTCILRIEEKKANSKSKFEGVFDSPGHGFIDASGVQSVRSSVGALFGDDIEKSSMDDDNVAKGIMTEFCKLYSMPEESLSRLLRNVGLKRNPFTFDHSEGWSEGWASGCVGEELQEITAIRHEAAHLSSPGWLYQQTPRFTLSSHPKASATTRTATLPRTFPPAARVHLSALNGRIIETDITLSHDESSAAEERAYFDSRLNGKEIYTIHSFVDLLEDTATNIDSDDKTEIAKWLDTIFGKSRPADGGPLIRKINLHFDALSKSRNYKLDLAPHQDSDGARVRSDQGSKEYARTLSDKDFRGQAPPNTAPPSSKNEEPSSIRNKIADNPG